MPDTNSPTTPPRTQIAKQLEESAAAIRSVRDKLDAAQFPPMRADPNSQGYREVIRSLYETRLQLAGLGLTLARHADAIAAEPNKPALELAKLDVRLARLNAELARAEMELQERLATPTSAPDKQLQKAQQVIGELRTKERQLVDQRIVVIQSALVDLRRLGIGQREASAKPPGHDEIPDFPWPPPKVSALQVIPENFFAAPSEPNCLGDVDKRLCCALTAREYFDLSYFAVPDGFALVTRVEQINADGTPKDRSERFADGPTSSGRRPFTEYIKALFLSRPGYYRIIVFVVTSHPFSQSPGKINREQADAWFSSGANVLPSRIASLKWTPEYRCTALVYEFDQPNPGVLTTPRVPGRHQGREHLVAAKLWQALEVKP